MFHFKSWLMVTPSNLALVTNSRGLPFRTRGSKSWLLFENPIRSSLHLASFSWNPSRLAYLERSSRASWSLLSLPFVTISEQDVSSTYFHMSTGVSKLHITQWHKLSTYCNFLSLVNCQLFAVSCLEIVHDANSSQAFFGWTAKY